MENETERLQKSEEEILKIWERLVRLEEKSSEIETFGILSSEIKEIKKMLEASPASFIQEASNASKQTSTYYNKAKEKVEELSTLVQEYSDRKQIISVQLDKVEKICNDLLDRQKIISEQAPAVQQEYMEIEDYLGTLDEYKKTIDNNFNQSSEWKKQSEECFTHIQQNESEGNNILKKIASLHTQSVEIRDDINDVHDQIFGYDYNDDQTGENKHEKGLQAELENSFNDLKQKINGYEQSICEFENEHKKHYEDFLRQKENEHKTLKEKIESLLPQALTAGLSFAYEQKKKEEEIERQNATKVFRLYIGLMTFVALIPLCVLSYLYGFCNMEFSEIILRAPKLVFTIFPVYAPLVWLAVVANKKINLSKRQIEEYSHKEALSKTFEGLSRQIESLPDENVSKKLKEQLLFNIVTLSAENPGKLISNYDRSDNPIMEILEKSEALGKSQEKWGKLPGLNLLIQNLSQKNEDKLQKSEDNIKQGLENAEDRQ